MSNFDSGQWQRWFSETGNEKGNRPSRGIPRVFLIPAIIISLFIILNITRGLYSEWLWFSSLNYGDTYATIFKTKVAVFLTGATLFCLIFLGNLLLATRLVPKSASGIWPWAIVSRLQPILRWNVILGTLILSLIFGLVARDSWLVVLRFFNGQPFGINDPVFNREVSFYVFSLPFQHLVRGWLMGALIISLLGSAGIYFLSYAVQQLKFDFPRRVAAHIGGLVIAILCLFAWGYRLNIWELVFSERGLIFGASYADMQARVPAQWALFAVVIIFIGIIIATIIKRNRRWPLYGIGGWIAASIIITGIFPGLVQRFQVQPNELVRERPYIEYNIEFTRKAFALDRVEDQPFPAEASPTMQNVVLNEGTINNIRLWDHRPLKDTYNQIQSIRLYYDFHDVDVDRYTIDGDYRQVMLSARELSAEKLSGQAQTWVNRRLQFTHGYGLALSPVNEISAEGLPTLLIKDIPPVGDFNIERPQIYFGEKSNDYIIVGTNTEEFDYPMGDENVFNSYEGRDGVTLNSPLRRLLYAWQLGDINILISSELTRESRVIYYRNIRQRVNHLAPFLQLDSDPYLVIDDGRLVWIQDAYTTSNRYPYSEPMNGSINYIRNSVKAVIDAYDGSVTFYVTDSEDALIRTYQTIFPDLFVPAEQMPDSMRRHLRYPEDMFNIQAHIYNTYHMQDARVFYNKEDLWTRPREIYASQEQVMEPYYIIMRLPGEDTEEFLLMSPFTPVNKNNTIGWLAGRSDGDNYGRLLAYHFPKERLVYGPSQIENRIQQDTEITEQLALWGRGGSQVIRGNLLLIPLGDSNLYVEPVFLQANAGGLPELKRVIVAAGDQIAMKATLEESLMAIFGIEASTPPAGTTTSPVPEEPGEPEATIPATVSGLIQEARQHYNQAQQYIRDGDWANYGKEMDALSAVLQQLAELTGD